MKVTIEIDDSMLKAAAGIVALQAPQNIAEIMEYAEKLGTQDVSITKEQLGDLSNKDKNYSQVSLIIAILALVAKASEEEKEYGKDV